MMDFLNERNKTGSPLRKKPMDIAAIRSDELAAMGLKYNFHENSYFGSTKKTADINVHYTEILYDSDEEWDIKINKIEQELERRK